MRVIKSGSGFLAYQKFLNLVKSKHSRMVLWQVFPQSGERKIVESRLISYHLDSGLLQFALPLENLINREIPIYCYSEEGQFIFKSEIHEIKNMLGVRMPIEIKLLEDPDITVIRGQIGLDLSDVWKVKRLQIETENLPDYMIVKSMAQRSSRDQEFLSNEFNSISLDEEEKLFADKRETPRVRPKLEKWVKVKSSENEDIHLLRLFDLSQGGIGFITNMTNLFPKGSEVRVVGFKEFDLDDPLIGTVMSHRPLDELELEFKIGCKFVEGQN